MFCPFNLLRDDAIERHREHPAQVADAMTLEHMSLTLNPRGTLYKGRSLIQITHEAGNQAAIEQYQRTLEAESWALYRVRRIYSRPGKADRAVETLAVLKGQMMAWDACALKNVSMQHGIPIEQRRGIPYVWREHRSESIFPTREEFLTVGPARVEDKTRYGLAWFEERWSALQLRLF